MKALMVVYWRQLARWWVLTGQPARALRCWENIAALRPLDARVLATLAGQHESSGRLREAIALMRRSIALDPSQAYAHFNLGFLLQRSEDHHAAVTCFEQAIELDPRLDQAHYGKALSLIAIGQPDQAIEPLRINTSLQPLSPYGFYQLAHLLNRLGRADEARRIIRQLSSFEPQVARRLQRETGIDAGMSSL